MWKWAGILLTRLDMMLYNTDMIQFQTSFTDTQYTQLKDLSKETGIPIAEAIRRAVDQYLDLILAVRQSSLRYCPPEMPLMHTTEEPDDASNH